MSVGSMSVLGLLAGSALELLKSVSTYAGASFVI